jgi:hypothetical protein
LIGIVITADAIVSNKIALSFGTRSTKLLPAQTATVDQEQSRKLGGYSSGNVRKEHDETSQGSGDDDGGRVVHETFEKMLDYSCIEDQVQMGMLLFKKGSKQIKGLKTCLRLHEESVDRDKEVARIVASKGYQHGLKLASGVVLGLNRFSVQARGRRGEKGIEKDVGEISSRAGLVASIWAVTVVAERVEDKVLGIGHGGTAGAREMDKRDYGTLEPDTKAVFAGYGRAEGFENRDEGRQLVRIALDVVAKDGAQFVV